MFLTLNLRHRYRHQVTHINIRCRLWFDDGRDGSDGAEELADVALPDELPDELPDDVDADTEGLFNRLICFWDEGLE